MLLLSFPELNNNSNFMPNKKKEFEYLNCFQHIHERSSAMQICIYRYQKLLTANQLEWKNSKVCITEASQLSTLTTIVLQSVVTLVL